jgi:septal ring factor EnvC (AmiA/AmiB activator)
MRSEGGSRDTFRIVRLKIAHAGSPQAAGRDHTALKHRRLNQLRLAHQSRLRIFVCTGKAAMTPTTLQAPPQPREDQSQLQQAHAKLAQLEQLLKQGRTHLQSLRAQVDEAKRERDQLRGRLEQSEAERDEISEKHDHVAFLLTELRADRDRVADELKATASHRVALEGQLESASGGLEQLRAAADRALTLAREIVEMPSPDAAPHME